MSTNIEITLRGIDKASDVIKGVSDKIVGSQESIRTANNKVDKSGKDVAIAFNNVATSGLALYNAVDRVQDMQVQVDRANLNVKTSLHNVEEAQNRYNTAVGKYGEGSVEAQGAAADLQLAQERYEIAIERAQVTQGNLNEAMVQSAVTVIPSLITMITSVSTLTSGWTAVTEGISGAMSFLAANPIILVVAGIIALVAGLIWAYQNCEPFRNAVDAIATVLGGALSVAINSVYGALKWLWDSILVPLGNFLTGTLLAAWNTLANGISWAYNNILKPVFDALKWVWDNIIKPIADVIGAVVGAVTGFFGGGGTPSNEKPGAGGRLQHGGLVTKPMFGLLGEAGPEAVIPLANLGGLFQRQSPVEITIPQSTSSVTVEINSPMVYVEGAADLRTARMCAQLIKGFLKNVVIEASSVNAPTGQSQIRIGSSTSSFGSPISVSHLPGRYSNPGRGVQP